MASEELLLTPIEGEEKLISESSPSSSPMIVDPSQSESETDLDDMKPDNPIASSTNFGGMKHSQPLYDLKKKASESSLDASSVERENVNPIRRSGPGVASGLNNGEDIEERGNGDEVQSTTAARLGVKGESIIIARELRMVQATSIDVFSLYRYPKSVIPKSRVLSAVTLHTDPNPQQQRSRSPSSSPHPTRPSSPPYNPTSPSSNSSSRPRSPPLLHHRTTTPNLYSSHTPSSFASAGIGLSQESPALLASPISFPQQRHRKPSSGASSKVIETLNKEIDTMKSNFERVKSEMRSSQRLIESLTRQNEDLKETKERMRNEQEGLNTVIGRKERLLEGEAQTSSQKASQSACNPF